MKRLVLLLLSLIIIFGLTSCSSDISTVTGEATTNVNEITEKSDTQTSTTHKETTTSSDNSSNKIDVIIGDTKLTATLADNSSAKAFAELLGQGDITVSMHDYNNFEKVGNLPQSIVTNNKQITTEPGDIILYQGNQITIYYDTNSWNFTQLGKIDGASKQELKSLLGNGDVTVTFGLHHENTAKKTLVAYFSATGNTKNIANYIKDAVDADIYEITPETPYTSDDLNYGDSNSRTSKEQNNSTARPKLKAIDLDLSAYKTVYLGYPIWWGQSPKIIYTFLESYDFSGITIIPFCTSGSSEIGSSDTNLHSSATNATWKTGKRFSGNADKSSVAEWVNS